MGNFIIQANRRRKGGGPVGRADAPRRDRPTASGQPGGMSGGGFMRPTFGGGMSGGRRLGGCGTLLVLILVVGFFLLNGMGGLDLGSLSDGTDLYAPAESGFEPVEPVLPVSNFTPPAPAASAGQTWTVLLYQDADDQVLERDIYLDLNEAERVGSSPNVQIVAQIDRYRAGYQGDGDWTSARRYHVLQDFDLDRINSPIAQELGEVDMSDGRSLVDFVRWGAENFPADRYVLILSDHGLGWPGGWSDPAPGGSNTSRVPLAARLGDQLYLMELDQALAEARAAAGIDRFELIGMDACLMAQVEVMTALEPHARYAVASEEVEPSIGWAYASFLGGLVENPDMSGADLGRIIVQSYIEDDQRVQDPAARAEFMRSGSPLGGLFGMGEPVTADQLASQLGRTGTLTAIDLDALPDLTGRLNAFAYQLQNEDERLIAQARNYAQSYTSIFGQEVPASFIDLGHFALLLKENTSDAETRAAAEDLAAALGRAVIAEKHGPGRQGSTGLAVYFPNSTLYRSPLAGPQSYTGLAERFASVSLWDDFLGFHYTGRSFGAGDAVPVVPPEGLPSRAPGQGSLRASEIIASSDRAAPGQPVTLSVDVEGENLGYIYLFAGYLDPQANSLNVTDVDFLESPETRELNGVYYPDWGGSRFTLSYTWDPIVFGIDDGTQNAVALFTPEQYGPDASGAAYIVEGRYTFAEGGDSQTANLQFRDGALTAVYGFTGDAEAGAPREITPAAGDSFTVFEKWMDLDSSGNVTAVVKEDGPTLTFGAGSFTWVELYAASGDYVVGFILEDLDGNQVPVYTRITVD